MRSIEGMEKAKSILGNFSFSEFCIVRELRYYEASESSGSAQNIDLHLETVGRKPNYRIKLVFLQVSGFRLDGFGGGKFSITGLNISDVSDRQWNGINWEVSDFESNAIEFRSFAATIESVEPVDQ